MPRAIPIRLIVADLDGTLLNSSHVVSPFTERAVREAIRRGVLVTVATGKTFHSTVDTIRQFDIRIPVICANGALVFEPDGALLHADPIRREYAIEAVRIGRSAGFTPVVYTRMGLLSTTLDENVLELLAYNEPVPGIIPDLETALANEVEPYKLMLMQQDPVAVTDLQIYLEEAFRGRAQVVRSGLASLVEVLPLGVTKGTALAYILDHLSIAPEETISFGDNCNDLDLIRRAGIGVAMGHSPDDLR
ncbi:MAG TPA: HAD family hydrolase, partial [Aggregatilineaceae bacterium]|nr:HAD family hydrolase [Aggregatilineaceae bacterium]